jgi:hypothetical protein
MIYTENALREIISNNGNKNETHIEIIISELKSSSQYENVDSNLIVIGGIENGLLSAEL